MTLEEQIIICQEIMLAVPVIERGGVWASEPGNAAPVMGFVLKLGKHNIGGGGYQGVFGSRKQAEAHALDVKRQARELLKRSELESARQGTFIHNEIVTEPTAHFEHVASEHCPCRPKFIDANDMQSTDEYFGRSPTGWDA